MKRFIGLGFILMLILLGCTAQAPPETPLVETVEPELLTIQYEYVKMDFPVIRAESLDLFPIVVADPAEVPDDVEITGSSLNRNYEWYIDQGNTGEHSFDNCGPSCAVMAMSWYDADIMLTPEQLRHQIRPEGGWWYTDDIERVLAENGVPMSYMEFNSADDFVGYIDTNRIAIICLDMGLMDYYPEDYLKIGKYYDGGMGHFIVAKGYRYINGELFIQVYDPWSVGMRYSYPDGDYKGKDRLYPADELERAIRGWWNWLMVVG